MILFLHGATREVDTQEETLLYNAVPKYATENEDFSFIVIAPQSPPPGTWLFEAERSLGGPLFPFYTFRMKI